MNLDEELERCNEFIEWLEENNDIDLNEVKLRVRVLDERFFVSIEWTGRSKTSKPGASELIGSPDWVIEPWFWNGESWMAGFWRKE